jgi:hypothetical protein
MKAPQVLPPAPLNATCPLWLLVEWSEMFRSAVASRSKVLLEVSPTDGPRSAEERWLALVSWNPKSSHLRTALKRALRRDYEVPSPASGLDRETVGTLFHKMTTGGQCVWFVPLFEWGGSAIFIRKPKNDPSLAALLRFNRQSNRRGAWRLPRRRHYPDVLRKGYAEAWVAEEERRSHFAMQLAGTICAMGLPPRRRRQGGTPQA